MYAESANCPGNSRQGGQRSLSAGRGLVRPLPDVREWARLTLVLPMSGGSALHFGLHCGSLFSERMHGNEGVDLAGPTGKQEKHGKPERATDQSEHTVVMTRTSTTQLAVGHRTRSLEALADGRAPSAFTRRVQPWHTRTPTACAPRLGQRK